MTVIALHPAEPPADDVAEVLELAAYAREQLQACAGRVDVARRLALYTTHGGTPALLARVLLGVREAEADLWRGELVALHDRAAALGITL